VKVLANEFAQETADNALLGYSSTPAALGTLVFSDAEFGGTDGSGNAYLPGRTGYYSFGGGFFAVQHYQSKTQFQWAATAEGPYNYLGSIAATESGELQLVNKLGSSITMGGGGTSYPPFTFIGGQIITDTGMVVTHPGSGVAETWQDVTPPAGASGLLRYQAVASPPRQVQIQANLTFSPAVSGEISLFTLGAGYDELANPYGDTGSGVSVSTSGVVTADVPSGTTSLEFCLLVPFD
jgi:hypothetical protein